MNVGDVCRCSIKSRQAGIRHNIYAGERPVPRCDPWTNNADKLHHYRVLICPPTNFLVSGQPGRGPDPVVSALCCTDPW